MDSMLKWGQHYQTGGYTVKRPYWKTTHTGWEWKASNGYKIVRDCDDPSYYTVYDIDGTRVDTCHKDSLPQVKRIYG